MNLEVISVRVDINIRLFVKNLKDREKLDVEKDGLNKEPRGTSWVILLWGDICFEILTSDSRLVI